MENYKCPHCEAPLGNGVTVCGECGKELDAGQELTEQAPAPEARQNGKKIYAILAVFLVVVGGAALLLFTGMVPNPLKSGTSVAAIVNGEKILQGDVDQKLEVYKKIYGQRAKTDFSSPEGKAALADMEKQVLNAMIQEKILVTEAAKEKIVVSPQEIKDKISSIKKAMNLSDKDFEEFLKGHAMSAANFEKRVEKEALITRLIAKGTQEKGLTKDDWLKALNDRAKVEVFAK
ncbi:MAG: SurA N-terminal domain-containing protein [Deltaproteobacteria bacterium]|nr:SurA N-terminal domain-containing protein [Deltaproteobacteria bacterium]